MKEMGGGKLSHEALEEIRIRAAQRVEAGESPEVVIYALGFHRPAIYKRIFLCRECGVEALRGREASGQAPKLN